VTAAAQGAFLHLSPPDVGAVERKLLLEAFDSGWVAPAGPDLTAFEDEVASLLGVRAAVALSSGTAALHLALLVLGVRAGDKVVVPSLTFAATANAVRYLDATPLFVDSLAATWTLDPEMVADELGARATSGRPLPKAVVAVDLYGQCADYDALLEVCDRYEVPLVEDAAEALGSTYRGCAAGTFGTAGVLSFNGNKIITTGGGGMLVTDDDALARRVRYLATQARDPVPHYEHQTVGYNYRLSNLLAAVGRGQLSSLADKVAARRATNTLYREAFAGVPGLEFMPVAGYGESNCWLTAVTVDPAAFGATRDDIRTHLESLRIESRPTWKPMHLQPAFRGCTMRGGEVSEDVYARGLCLPSGSGLSDNDRARVVEAVLSAPGAVRRR